MKQVYKFWFAKDLAMEECSIIVMLYKLKQICFSQQKNIAKARYSKLVLNQAVGANWVMVP